MNTLIHRTAFAAMATAIGVLLPGQAAIGQQKDAEPATRAANATVLKELPFGDRQSFEDAKRGFIAGIPDALIPGSGPRPVWSMKPYEFLAKDEAPATVNPSLWRHAQINTIHGLFKVTDRIYQIRGMDLANMTIVEGDTGLIIIDVMTTKEGAKAALDLYYQHRPRKPVVAIAYTHSHADHFGGVKGAVSEADVQAGKVKIFAPDRFIEFAVSENIIAGNAMYRRAQYQFGPLVPAGERGQVDAGLGKASSSGAITLIPPTDLIVKEIEERTIDGVKIVFQLTPGTEAPSEMNRYLPQFRVLDMAENVSQTMHQLYTIRGAEIRDGNAWAKYLNEALQRFGDKSDIMITSHNWPTWGQDQVVARLKKQRDLYKFTHDQTLRLMNNGYTPMEISEVLKLPASLSDEWSLRGYYGTLRHNSKGQYQKYLGWYDGNPSNLDPLPPAASAKKYVEYMGGAEPVIKRARDDFKRGEYRWVASLMSHVVFADPANKEARELGADALEQLGYQAESANWRNAYLTGAQELRKGAPSLARRAATSEETIKALTVDMLFDFLGVRLNGERADGQRIVINWNFTDIGTTYVLNLENSALTYISGKPSQTADASVTLTRATLDTIILGKATFPAAVTSGDAKVEGQSAKVNALLDLLDQPDPNFPIVEPKKSM